MLEDRAGLEDDADVDVELGDAGALWGTGGTASAGLFEVEVGG